MEKRLSDLIARLALIAPMLVSHASPARAHHSWAPYDVEREVTLQGLVTEYKWANPHSYIRLQTAGEDGGVEVWEIEASSAVVMRNRGWSADTIAVGDRVTIQANRNAPTVVAPEVGADSLAGLWRTTITPEVRDHFFFFEPTDWPLTEAGVRAFQAFENGDNPGKDCVAYASPFLMIIPDAKMITLGEDDIVIRTELESVERIIHLNQSSHEGVEPSVQGHSIGRWEGDVLVVDTARFAEHGMGNAQKLPSGPDKRLTERFALSPNGRSISYSFEMTDPDYLAEPIGYEMEWVYSPDFEMVRLPCDPESAQRYLDLR
jgi:hypothetical protein